MPKTLHCLSAKYHLAFTLKESAKKQIYKAYRVDKSTGIKMDVLLKVFHRDDPNYKLEMESLMAVNSSYCVRLLGFEDFGKKKALVLEYIEGVSLSELIKNFQITDTERKSILSSIYRGLLDLKSQGLCHGDLSLDNILIDGEGQLKFIDFGSSNYQGCAHGTPPFIAPEILDGARASFLSDLFSVGIIDLYLKNPEQSDNLQKISSQNLGAHKTGLLSQDPAGRQFLLDPNLKIPDSLSHKIKHILSSLQSKRQETEEIAIGKQKSSSMKSIYAKLALIVLFGFYAGATSFSHTTIKMNGLLQVVTNQWTLVHLDEFQSYAPFHLPVSPGWHIIRWETARDHGKKIIYIRKGKTLLLNDKDFGGVIKK